MEIEKDGPGLAELNTHPEIDVYHNMVTHRKHSQNLTYLHPNLSSQDPWHGQ